jgi:tetratricopeptide (TPR) repeat protein
MARLPLLLILAAGALPGAWTEYRAGPFLLLADGKEDQAREALNHLEQMRHVLGQWVGIQEMKTEWPVVVVFQPAVKGAAPALGFSRAGYVAQWTPGQPPARTWFRRVALWLLDGSLAGHMPEGWEEALADLVSTLQVERTRLLLGAPIPSAERTPAYALLHMLATDPATSGRLRILLANLARGGEAETAFRNAFEATMAGVLKRGDDYAKAGRYEPVQISGRALDAERFKSLPLAPSQARLLPGDLALARQAWSEARRAYVDVLNSGATAAAHEGLALALLGDGDQGAALAELEGAVKGGTPGASAGARAFYEHGRLVAEPERSLKSFEQALVLQPGWAEVHTAVAERADTPAKKVFALKRATDAAPRQMRYWRAYATALEAKGDFTEARKAWRAAERAARSAAEREELNRLAEAADEKRLDAEAAERRRQAEAERSEVERVRREAMERIREAEERARRDQGQPPQGKIEKWWDGPRGQEIEATLERVDCLGARARLQLKTAAGKPLALLIAEPGKVALIGLKEATLGCGPQKPPKRVKVEYAPKPDPKLGTAGEVLIVEFQ